MLMQACRRALGLQKSGRSEVQRSSSKNIMDATTECVELGTNLSLSIASVVIMLPGISTSVGRFKIVAFGNAGSAFSEK